MKNPVSNIAALSTLAVLLVAVKRMIKKYHKNQEIFY